MVAGQNDDPNARLADLISRLAEDKSLDALLAAFARGDLTEDQIVTEIAVRYQRSIGSAAQALAEHNKIAAKQLGERLRGRIDEFLKSLADRDTAGSAKPQRPAGMDSFKERDDAVLLREFVILKALARQGNQSLKSASIFAMVNQTLDGAQDEAITAHLARMVKAGLVGKERKGRYNQAPQGAVHLTDLVSEIEARGLKLPALPDPLPE
jgi:DNA-binding transcriptional ArsR family regulator